MKTQDNVCLYEVRFPISQLIHEKVKLKDEIWLREGKVFLRKNKKDMNVYILLETNNDDSARSIKRKVMPYLWVSSLISLNTAHIGAGSMGILESRKEFGKGDFICANVELDDLPDEAVGDVEHYAPEFIYEITQLHEKYIKVIEANKFISRSLYYYYESRRKGIYSDDGFISAMISLESMFNEGPTDIKYKLSLRGAFLLSLTEFDGVEVFQNLKYFYNHRSNLIHGKKDIHHDPERGLLCKYSRSAVIIFLILLSEDKQETGSGMKEDLLNKIDQAMLDPEKEKHLKNEIQEKISDFRLKTPRVFEGKGERGPYKTTVW